MTVPVPLRLVLLAAVVSSNACIGFLVTHPPQHATTSCRHRHITLHAASNRAAEGAAAAATTPTSRFSRARDVLDDSAFRKLLAPMGAAGALLGPNLDNYHSAFGVLSYKNGVELSLGGHVLLTTDWW